MVNIAMKMLKDFVEMMEKEEIPCFIFLLKDKNDTPMFIEVIVKRPFRYTKPHILKKIPKTWKGIKVKVL